MLLVFVAIYSFVPLPKMTVSGIVIDNQGNPLPMVTVNLKNSKTVVATCQGGKFSIEVGKFPATLVFKMIGYQQKEIIISNNSFLKVALTSSTSELMEVVVTGLGKADHQINTTAFSPTVKYSESDNTNSWNDKDEDFNTENYDDNTENGFHRVTDDPLSTFSIDVDAASYSNVRRFLNEGQLPPAGAVRIEEMINYFKYQYPQPVNNDPFSISTEIGECPWNQQNKLLMIGLQGKEIPLDDLPASNLVFLIDVSGSMMQENKLPLVKASLKLLTNKLRIQDNISIVVYAGNAGVVLPATSGNRKDAIMQAIDGLEAGGSTAGGAGIKLAYKIARDNKMSQGNNRVILCTDGDFNVGASSDDDMVRLIEKERNSGVYLTVLGFGMGNYKDNKMQQLADKGNGNHAYIDGINEAKKVLINEFGGTLFTIAKDVKLQVEFNPATIAGYRLIGYENRMLNKEDFNDDKKDAGELGSGHTVTALYEIIPAGSNSKYLKKVDELKYQSKPAKETANFETGELLTVKFRYKQPTGDMSKLIVNTVKGITIPFDKTSDNFRFASAVASFGMLLRDSEFKGTSNYNNVVKYCKNALQRDEEGYRKEFVSLVIKAEKLSNSKITTESQEEESR